MLGRLECVGFVGVDGTGDWERGEGAVELCGGPLDQADGFGRGFDAAVEDLLILRGEHEPKKEIGINKRSGKLRTKADRKNTYEFGKDWNFLDGFFEEKMVSVACGSVVKKTCQQARKQLEEWIEPKK